MSIKIDIISGFLGAGKTTFLNKIIPHMKGRTVLIENEFGDVGVDGDLITGDLPVKEIYAGCICCNLTISFRDAIQSLIEQYKPDRIIIEPSGVGRLTDIIKACKGINIVLHQDLNIHHLITIVDVSAFHDYKEDFGTFYLDQIQNSNIILLSHLTNMDEKEIQQVISDIRNENTKAIIFQEDWYTYEGREIKEFLDSVEIGEDDVDSSKGTTLPAGRVFSSCSLLNPRVFTEEEIEKVMELLKSRSYGHVLRGKGILSLDIGKRIHFDFTPQGHSWEYVQASKEPKVTMIGCELEKEKLVKLFQ